MNNVFCLHFTVVHLEALCNPVYAPPLRVFFKVKSRSAHMKSHAEQEKKAAALRLREAEERAAAALSAARQNGAKDGSRAGSKSSSSDDSSDEDEDADDEDWH